VTTSTTTRPVRAVLARVRAVHHLTPHMTRVTFHAPAFGDLSYLASDHYVRLLLPNRGQTEPSLPLSDRWWPEMVAMPPAQRPILRNYTVSDLRPESGELDIDFVRHGDSGPATRWANRAERGHAVGIIDQGVLHEPRGDARQYLIVGDETALPAVAGLLRALPATVSATVVVEVPSAADRQDLFSSADIRVDYRVRVDPHGQPGRLLAAAVRDWQPSQDRVVAWIAGESTMTTAVRRGLVRAGIPKADICFHGYFKFGKAQY
jgi:NADPH-dependent ferric siderophore reductase